MNARQVEVYGHRLFAERTDNGWQTYAPGDDGKRDRTRAVRVPQFVVTDEDLLQYLADLFHESARPDRQTVRFIT